MYCIFIINYGVFDTERLYKNWLEDFDFFTLYLRLRTRDSDSCRCRTAFFTIYTTVFTVYVYTHTHTKREREREREVIRPTAHVTHDTSHVPRLSGVTSDVHTAQNCNQTQTMNEVWVLSLRPLSSWESREKFYHRPHRRGSFRFRGFIFYALRLKNKVKN